MIDPDELREVLAANILRLRLDKGWSQKELATRLGVSFVTVNRLENGHASPSAELLYTLADVLGVTTDTFRQACEKISAS